MGRTLVALAAVVIVLAAGYWLIFLRGSDAAPAAGGLGVTLPYDQYATTTGSAGAAQSAGTAPTSTNSPQPMTTAILHTTKGDITIEFFGADAPKTVENFTKLAAAGFYNGTKFHRVIKAFMIQGGDPLSKDDTMVARWGTGGPGYQFADEIHANNHNVTGTISMANSGPDTNGSQFFINTADNSFLDTKHTTFGRVTAGMDAVRAIEATPTGAGDRPLEPMVITSITLK